MPDKEKDQPKSDAQPPPDATKTAKTIEVTAEAVKFLDEPRSKSEVPKSRAEDMPKSKCEKSKAEESKMAEDKKEKKERTKKSNEKVIECAESPVAGAPAKPPKLRKEQSGSVENAVARVYDDEEEEKDKEEARKEARKKGSQRKKSSKPGQKDETSSRRKVRKRTTHTSKSSDETKNKLEKLKQNLIKQENSKRSTKSKKSKSKIERKQEPVKKSLRERLKKKFDSIGVFFTSKGYQMSVQKAQKKNSSVLTKKVGAGDDAFPVNLAQRKAMEGDSYEECEAGLMKDTAHRADLTLVKNKDNHGNLFMNGKPFWKDKKFNSEIQPDNKLLSKVLVEVVNQKRTLMDPSDEPAELDELQDFEEMKARDQLWFKEEHIMSNTIRSIVATTTEEAPPTPKKTDPLKPLTVVEPKQMLSYRRHFVSQGVNVTFVKSPANMELRRLKVKKSKSTSGSSASPSSNNSSEDKKKEGKKK